jgi:PAS domain-containing protein
MKINVNDCLKLDSFRNAVILAGADSLDRRVKSVSVFDEADLGMGVERNGEKDQMVLTHFWTCSNDIDVQKKIVSGLASRGVSALVVFLNERGVSGLSEEVVKEADGRHLPLIAIAEAEHVTYSMLIEQVIDKILYGETYSDNVLNSSPNGIVVVNDKLEVQQINRTAIKMLNLRSAADVLGEPVVRILDPIAFLQVQNGGSRVNDQLTYLAEYNRYVEQTIVSDAENHMLICFLRDVTDDQKQREKKEQRSRMTIETADNVVEKQMRIVQEIASLLGETAAETKIALTKLKESMIDE